MTPPRRLSTFRYSPNYDKLAIAAIDKVYCDDELVPECQFYDMDKGECRGRGDPVLRHGKITVTMK